MYSLVGLHDQKQKLESSSDVFELDKSNSTFDSKVSTLEVDPQEGDRLKIFWSRALTCIIAPLLVTGYYIGLYLHWISSYDADGPVPQGPPGGRWAYYTWSVLVQMFTGLKPL